ncbi:MAG: chemotaxis protein CheD [Proteobacteria bacterium]|nr:chemotaxis protein CheD [Pseudomonadota bacterium]MBU4295755.1 chemotaxis protein CheD [Pseudomonadota bacterium]
MALPAKPVRYYLKPGELFLGEEAAVVKTLLGSCVAVTMFSPRYHVGSVCHGVLPSCRNEHPCVGDCRDGPRYVDCAIRRMLEWFLTQGIARDEIVVKVFGGSDMYSTPEGNERKGVGKQNIDMALKTLEQEGLRLAASDVGGLRGRKVIFRIYSGEVFLKRLSSSEHKE